MAVDYTNRTGRDGMALSPLQLSFAMGVLRERERRERIDMAEAMSAAMTGNKDLLEHIAR
jgi:hypothetical protein